MKHLSAYITEMNNDWTIICGDNFSNGKEYAATKYFIIFIKTENESDIQTLFGGLYYNNQSYLEIEDPKVKPDWRSLYDEIIEYKRPKDKYIGVVIMNNRPGHGVPVDVFTEEKERPVKSIIDSYANKHDGQGMNQCIKYDTIMTSEELYKMLDDKFDFKHNKKILMKQ